MILPVKIILNNFKERTALNKILLNIKEKLYLTDNNLK